MKYFTSYFWPEEDDSTNYHSSLVLQQCQHAKTGLPVAFGVICRTVGSQEQDTTGGKQNLTGSNRKTDGGGRSAVTEYARNCVNWYYDGCLSMSGTGTERDRKKMLESLDDLLMEAPESLAGALCIGENIILFQKGDMNVYLLNERWNTAQVRPLFPDGNRLQTCCVTPEENTAILIASRGFRYHIPKTELAACLRPREIRVKQQARQRMQELGRVAQEPGILITFRGE